MLPIKLDTDKQELFWRGRSKMVAAIPGYYSKNLCGQKAFKLVLLKVILLSRDLRFVNYRERKSPPLR